MLKYSINIYCCEVESADLLIFAMLCLEALWYDMKEIYEIRQLQFAIIKRYTEFL